MCGFAGILAHHTSARVEDAILMARAVAHRGPDGAGHYHDGSMALAHHRLAIMDPTDAGAQPLHWRDKRYTIVFNGEIYNAPELRHELEEGGHAFLSSCDTEVLLHLVAEGGLNALNKVDGMFAFALWDRNEQELLLVRDRLGIKPLFYARDGERLLFGSELAALVAAPGFQPEPDWQALKEFMRMNYVMAPRTGLAAVCQLLPGEALRVRPGQPVRQEIWWKNTVTRREWDPDDAQEAFNHTLLEAIKLRTRSDVGYGLLLSGGIDSSGIGVALKKLGEADCTAFTVGFEDPRFDESRQAALTANHLGIPQQVAHLSPSDLEALPSWIGHVMEPTADSSMLAYGALARLASSQRKVVLGGDGADELLAGYPTYAASVLAKSWRRLPLRLTRGAARTIPGLLPVSMGKVGWEEKTRRFLRGAYRDPASAHLAWREILSDEQIGQLIDSSGPGKAILTATGPEARWQDTYRTESHLPFRSRLLQLDQQLYLPNDMLTKVDRISMAMGLEVRVPYLSHHLVELVSSFPEELIMNRLMKGKGLLRNFLQGEVPAEIVHGKKRGFNIPVGGWLRGPCREFMMETLSPDRVRNVGVLDPVALQGLLQRHHKGQEDLGYAIFGILVLHLWWERTFHAAPRTSQSG